MSEKREFPILNGKLLSDLDLNGHKLLGSTLPEGGAGTSVEVVAPSPDGAGKAADAKAVYELVNSFKAAVVPCILKSEEGELKVIPTINAIPSAALYAETPIKNEVDVVEGWRGIFTCDLEVRRPGAEYSDYHKAEVELDTTTNCHIDESSDPCIVVDKDLQMFDNFNFFDNVAVLRAGVRLLIVSGSDGELEIYGENAADWTYDDNIEIYSNYGFGTLKSFFNTTGDEKQLVVALPAGDAGSSYFDYTITLESANKGAVNVSWRNCAGVIDKFPGASQMLPGKNVWRVTCSGQGHALVDRNNASADLILSSPSGRQAQLSVNDELVLEVKEV